MGTATIDVIQSAQITTLQNDVAELTTKLNTVVADIATLKDKVGTAYPAFGSGNYNSATDTIMERLYQIDKDVSLLAGTLNSHLGTHPTTGNQGSAGRSPGGTGALTALNSFSTSSTNASTTGVYTPQSQQVVVMTNDGATRAREVARSTLTKLRDL